jgi:hypothetical protein
MIRSRQWGIARRRTCSNSEVKELTDLLRNDDSFSHLRELLADRGLIASETILAGMISSEDNSDYGAFLTATGHCMAFETGPDGSLTRWERVDDITTLEDDFEAIAVGVSMQRRGRIS